MTKSLVIASCLTVATVLSSGADAANTSGGRMEQMFKKADKDNDGTLTRDEA